MLYHANRIRFEEEFVMPDFSMASLYKQPKPDLLNNKGQFFVYMSEKTPYLKELVRQAQNLNLTVSGDGTAPVKGGDIRQAKVGDVLTIGSSTRFDVNWAKRDQYVCQKGYRPVYDIVKDWSKIEKALKQYADEKNGSYFPKTSGNTTANYHTRFAVINGQVKYYPLNKVVIETPVINPRYFNDFETINLQIKVYRNF